MATDLLQLYPNVWYEEDAIRRRYISNGQGITWNNNYYFSCKVPVCQPPASFVHHYPYPIAGGCQQQVITWDMYSLNPGFYMLRLYGYRQRLADASMSDDIGNRL